MESCEWLPMKFKAKLLVTSHTFPQPPASTGTDTTVGQGLCITEQAVLVRLKHAPLHPPHKVVSRHTCVANSHHNNIEFNVESNVTTAILGGWLTPWRVKLSSSAIQLQLPISPSLHVRSHLKPNLLPHPSSGDQSFISDAVLITLNLLFFCIFLGFKLCPQTTTIS